MKPGVIGQKIRALRDSAGLTQEELSGRAKIANRALQKVEAGGNPELDTLLKLANALGVSPADFFETPPRKPEDATETYRELLAIASRLTPAALRQLLVQARNLPVVTSAEDKNKPPPRRS